MAVKKMFYSMGEVAEMFDVNASLIRHWESKFDCLRPHKNKKGNRMFTPEDVERLKQIYHLVKERGMTLDGANKVMKSSRKEISRDTELLERLQRIRASLVEVREELKAGDGEQLVEDSGAELAEKEVAPAAEVASAPEVVPAEASAVEEVAPAAAEVAVEAVAAPDALAEEVTPAVEDVEEEKPAVAEAPKKRTSRRRKKSDDEGDKELFPFYEQSLF